MHRFWAGFLCALAMPGAFAQTPDYFPLEVGNSWVYRSEGQLGLQSASIEVLRAREVEGVRYFEVQAFGREVLLRMKEDGTLVNRGATGDEQAWIPFATEAGESFRSTIDACVRGGRIETKSLKWESELGQTEQALRVDYEPSCVDAGILRDIFVPYVGLVERTMTSIAGPVTYKLVYSRTGVTALAHPERSFGISLNSTAYEPSATATVRLTLRNTLSELTLEFPSSQDYDVQIRDQSGEIVYTWSADKGFLTVFRTVTFPPGERNWLVEVPLSASLKPGKYTIEGWLATTPRTYVATTSFEIRAGN
jgi:hypothetical protein